MPASLIARIENSSQQRGPPRELATLDEHLTFPVTREDSPKSRVKSRCNIAHGCHTAIGDCDITRQQGDRTHGMVQDPAKCESGIGSFCFFETDQSLLLGLIRITLHTSTRANLARASTRWS